MFRHLKEDIASVFHRDPAARNFVEVLTCYPGLHALLLHRISHSLWTIGLKWLARYLSTLTRWLTGIEIHPGAQIGNRFFIDHGMGVVIGETAIIGDDVTLYHGVTLGGTTWEKGKRHPTLHDGVVVGAGAKILGPFEVGKNARVGSNAVVTKPVPANATVVGIPGRIIELPTEEEQKSRQDLVEKFDAYGVSSDLPDPVAKSISAMLDHMHAVDKKLHCMATKIKELDASYVDENLPELKAADFEAAIDPREDKKA
ncbi:MAG: serine O-acetyltransferase [Gammaproteobacteria bacterium]|nr:serine O-acetyltransferase [Gammaproteobacteria bacterium]